MGIQKTADQFYDSTLSRFLLLAWLITLPFGAWLLPLSLGSFTIYPNLVLTLLFAPLAVFTLRRWTKFTWIYLIFCILWLGMAILMAMQNGMHLYAKFDLRSLFMQTGFFLALSTAYHLLPAEKLLRYLKQGFHFYFVLLLAFGLFESVTGIHIAGAMTEKLLNLPESNATYMPMFIYDNPNDFMCYCLFLYLMVTNLGSSYYRDKAGLRIIILLLLFFFAFLGGARAAEMIITLLLACELFFILRTHLKKISFSFLWFYGAGAVLLVIVLFRVSFFVGPKFGDKERFRLNEFKTIEKTGEGYTLHYARNQFKKKELKTLSDSFEKQRTTALSSYGVRKNLVLNGITFIKEKPLLGIGPGGFQQRHMQYKVAYFAHTLTSPHNFPIEIISQFGILGWAYFAFIIWFFIRFLKRFLAERTRENFSYLLIFVALPLLWVMPSAYLYLDINWLLVPMLFILYETQKTGTDVSQ